MRQRICAVAGTRPEWIKLDPLLSALKARRGPEIELLWSGQHAPAPPEAQPLDAPQGHPLPRAELERQLQQGVEQALRSRTVDLLLVQGDTATALAAARAASRLSLAIVHLEAGLRSGSLRSPYPEEGYRRELSRLATLHLTPCRQATINLLREGVPPHRIHEIGSTAIDRLPQPAARQELPQLDLLVDVHRRENGGLALRRLACVLLALAADGWRIAVLDHANPHWVQRWNAVLGGSAALRRLAPMSRTEWLTTVCSSRLVLSDSGAAAEELPYLGVPLLCFRRHSERREAHATGHARSLDPRLPESRLRTRIIEAMDARWPSPWPRNALSPYGDGQAAERAVEYILGCLPTQRQLPPDPQIGRRASLHATRLSAVRSALQRLRRALILGPGPCPVPAGLVGAWSSSGQPLYLYPEIAGYWLRWAAARSDVEAHQGKAVVAGLTERLDPVLGSLPTRITLDDSPSPHAGARYLFDHAMVHAGLRAWAAARGCTAAERLARSLLPCLTGFVSEAGIQAHQGSARGGWSARPGPFLLKALARLPDLGPGAGAAVSSARVQLRSKALQQAHAEAHPQLYAIEGMFECGDHAAARQALQALLAAHGGVTGLRERVASGPRRSDVLAQVLRLLLLLPLPVDAAVSDALAVELLGLIDASGSIAFAEGRDERPTWAALFAEQALSLWLGEELQCLV